MADFADLQVAEQNMQHRGAGCPAQLPVHGDRLAEQAEEQEHVSGPHMLVLQMPFGLAVLAKHRAPAGDSWHSGPDKVRVQVSAARDTGTRSWFMIAATLLPGTARIDS